MAWTMAWKSNIQWLVAVLCTTSGGSWISCWGRRAIGGVPASNLGAFWQKCLWKWKNWIPLGGGRTLVMLPGSANDNSLKYRWQHLLWTITEAVTTVDGTKIKHWSRDGGRKNRKRSLSCIGGSTYKMFQCMPHPYRTQFFHFHTHFHQKVSTSDVHVP